MSNIGHCLHDEFEAKIAHTREFITGFLSKHHLMGTMMQYLDDLIAKQGELKVERASLEADRDAEKARADKAEADLAALQKQVQDDEDKAKAALADISAEVDAEKPVSASAPVTSVGSVSTTVTTADGSVTTLDHTTGTGSTVDPTGAATTTDTVAVDAARQAASEAGVSVPAAS